MIHYVSGDLFLSAAQTLAHGVNCQGVMGAGIARTFKNRDRDMYTEYRLLCKRGELRPGGLMLWRRDEPWILNLATQDEVRRADVIYVNKALAVLARHIDDLGITSVAMPLVGAGLGGLPEGLVKEALERHLGGAAIPIFVYDVFEPELPGIEDYAEIVDRLPPPAGEPVLFYGKREDPSWSRLSNFAATPISIADKVYPTVEHFFQAMKTTEPVLAEEIRTARTPGLAKRLGRRVPLREDWEDIKVAVMRTGLAAKFRQHPQLRELLMATASRPIHETSPHDRVWGWMDGEGEDLLGRTMVEVRGILKSDGKSQPRTALLTA